MLRLEKGEKSAAQLLQLNTSGLWKGQVPTEEWACWGKDDFEQGEYMLVITAQIAAIS